MIQTIMKKILLGMYCLLIAAMLQGQQRAVTGKVTDAADGNAIPGVSVLLKGSSQGTVTDADGNFSINASPGEVITFSFIGFEPKEVPVSQQTTLAVTLTASIQALQEVVVIGYGEKSRALMTESIGTVSSKEIQQLPTVSADAAIQGRISGVQITGVDGTPGSAVAVRIRGVGTTGNTQPLFVIDGIPVGTGDPGYGINQNPLSTLNSSDIETISVLKDASAAAVYGVRAANGVVLITTKRGKTGRPKISFDSYYGVQNFRKRFDWNDTQQYVAITQEALNARNTRDNLNPGDLGYQTLHNDLKTGSPYLNVNTDWQDAVIVKNAPISNSNLSVSGGNEASNYYVSAGYFKQEATIPNYGLERYSFRANSDYKIGSRFKFGQTVALSYQNIAFGANNLGDGFIYANVANMPPFFSIYDDPNNPIVGNRYGYNGNNQVAGLTIQHQLGVNNILKNDSKNYRLLGGIYAELEIIKGLKFRSKVSIDLNHQHGTSWNPGYTVEELGLDRSQNNFSDSRSEGYTQVFTNTLTYDKTLGDHNINVLAGYEYQKLRGNSLSYQNVNFLSNEPAFYQSVKNGAGNTGADAQQYSNAGSSLSNDAFAGIVGRISYDYKQKYLVTFSVRRDATAHFAEQNRLGTFPSVSAAWRISQEEFFSVPFISDLKLRGSWGQLGNANQGAFAHIFRVSFTPDYGLGNTTHQAPTQAAFVNKNLFWEKVQTTDFGFDVSFLDNKVSLLATYYNRKTKDFLYNLPLNWISGFDISPVNAGLVSNKGIELDLSYNGNVGRELKFSISGNLTTVKNRLESLLPGINEFSSGDYRTAVGYPIGYFYGYKTLGIYQNAAQAAAAPEDVVAGTTPEAGDIIFQDNNGPAPSDAPQGQQFSGQPNGEIDPADRTYLGKTIPDFFYGLSFNSNFKGFDLSIFFQGVSGVQVYNGYRQSAESLDAYGRNQFTSTQHRWTGENTSNNMPRAVAGDPYSNNRFSDRWIENAGFLRLKNIQLGYSFPSALLSKTKALSSARIYLATTNLFTITRYTGLDPEVMTVGSNTNQLGSGSDYANIPQPRTVQVGVQLQF
jgi:TonB-linked SusC/RagA family outer membrane protein